MKKTLLEEQKYLERTINKYHDLEKEYKMILETIPSKFSDNPVLRDSLMDIYEGKLIMMKRTEDKPYFARIDFKNDEDKVEEECYIGKVGVSDQNQKTITIDWRAPISNLYYDSNIGIAKYNSPSGIIAGEVLLKRQYTIDNKELINFQDVDTVSNDDIIAPYLNSNVDNRLKNIVSTIQKEQNDIIREKIYNNIIVQGVAGSGKTTVALHRIAYLVYNNMKNINPNEYIVIGPNKFFVNYISGVLPDLDVANAKQTTYDDIIRELTKEKFELLSDEQKLITSIKEPNKLEFERLKVSMEYKDALDKYLNDWSKTILPNEDLIINDYNIIPKSIIERAFNEVKENELSYEILNRKIERAILLLSKMILDNKERIKSGIREDEYLKINDGAKPNEESKKTNAIYKELKNGCTESLRKYFKKGKPKILQLYINFLLNFDKYIDNPNINPTKTIENLKKRKVEFEDLGAILYLHYRVYGNGSYSRYRHAVIDESQDFGELNFYALRKVMSSSTFTIFGDLAQSIYEYRGIKDWQRIIDKVFDGECSLKYLSKSYRTTTEIMLAANNITKHLNLMEATPVIRHGEKVKTINTNNKLAEIINILNIYNEKKFNSVALIAKTEEEAKEINKYLTKNNIIAKNITSKDIIYDGGLCTITSYLAKGLEFDAVIISNANEEEYNSNKPIDMKLLYVAMTRPLHELNIIYQENITKPLEILTKTSVN